MTVDLEPDLRSSTCKSMELLPKILEFFDRYNVQATFFTVTSLLEKYESEVKEISKKHEIASHSHTHTLGKTEIKKSMEEMKKFGIKCTGYRAPGFIVENNHFQDLREVGYEYDASLARYFPGRYSNWNLPTKPYKNNGITEFIEAGPGKVLSGLNRRIVPGMTSRSFDKMEHLNACEIL